MTFKSGVFCFHMLFVVATFGSPFNEKRLRTPNRDERFQVKNAEFQSIGCWKDSVESKVLLPLEGKHPLLMDGHGDSRANALMKCAEAAWDLDLKVFALQNGGECLGEQDGERKYMRNGMSNLCHGDGLGGPYSNEVYRFLGNTVVARDGQYTLWGAYGGCSTSCGVGTETRMRSCTDPSPYGGGRDCNRLGPATESRKCNVNTCP